MKTVDNKNISLEFVNGIIHLTYKEGLKIDLDMAKEVVVTRLNFQGTKQYPLLIIDKGVVSMDKNARDYFSTDEGTSGVSASALVLKSVFSTFLGNFFIKVTKPKIPVKIFTKQKDALLWLNQYHTNNE